MARASGTQPPVFANVGGGPGARGLQRMSETAEGCNLDGRWKVGSGDGPSNPAGCQNYRWKRSPRPVRCVSEPGGGMPDEVCVSMSCCYFGGLSAHARGPPRASTSGGGRRPVNSLSPRIGETRRGGGTTSGLARQGGWLSPYRRKRPVPVLCIDRWEGRICARGFQAIRHGMAWHGESHGIPKREQAMPGVQVHGYRAAEA